MIHAAAILLALAAGLIAGRLQTFTTDASPRLPVATLATAVIVAMMVAAQLAIPPLLPLLDRAPSMLQSGELWRALTALFVQDYGLTGALFNLATLLILGSVAEKRLGTAQATP